MKNIVEFCAQAALCRQLAICEPKNSSLWLAEAERWSSIEVDMLVDGNGLENFVWSGP